jgi:hypothetical protein
MIGDELIAIRQNIVWCTRRNGGRNEPLKRYGCCLSGEIRDELRFPRSFEHRSNYDYVRKRGQQTTHFDIGCNLAGEPSPVHPIIYVVRV